MNGQMKSFEEKKRIAQDYINKVNPYEKGTPLMFDLRAYVDYVRKNKVDASNITDEIMSKFIRV